MQTLTALDDWLALAGPAGFAYLYLPTPADATQLAGVRRWSPSLSDVWIIDRETDEGVGYRAVHEPHANPLGPSLVTYDYSAPAVHAVRAMLALPAPSLERPGPPRPRSPRALAMSALFAPPEPLPRRLPQIPSQPRADATLSRWFAGCVEAPTAP